MFTSVSRVGQALKSRRTRERSGPGGRRRARPQVEALETIELLSWASVPPALIAPPANSPPSSYLNGETLSAAGGASGAGININGEIDYYQFTATRSGTYVFDAVSPGHAMDTVIAVYDSSGNRLACNDDVARGDTNSKTSVTLTAGKRYSFQGSQNGTLQLHPRPVQLVDRRPGVLAGFQSAIESRRLVRWASGIHGHGRLGP